MARRTQAARPGSSNLESALAKLRGLSYESQAAIASIIDRMTLAEGSSVHTEHKFPAENIDLWLTKLRAERKSEGTVKLYKYLVKRFLKSNQTPTKADMREYLAKRIIDTSPSSAETERKAFASLFSFLHAEGLWPENPLEGVKHIGPRWGERESRCPTVGDVERVLKTGFMRAQDALKMRTVVTLLATTATGLRPTECMSLRRGGVDLEARELRVLGKGRKRRIVPLLESTAEALGHLYGAPRRETGLAEAEARRNSPAHRRAQILERRMGKLRGMAGHDDERAKESTIDYPGPVLNRKRDTI